MAAIVLLSGAVEAERAFAQAGVMREQRRDPAYETALRGIAEAIEALKPEYPQLAEFSLERSFGAGQLTIAYFYRTGPPDRHGGWTSGFPKPADDGLALSIDLHDPKSDLQMHTQPAVPLFRFRDKAVMLLMVEGSATRSLRVPLLRIFEQHDVRPVPRDWRGGPVEP
jgi:hypothetical protein